MPLKSKAQQKPHKTLLSGITISDEPLIYTAGNIRVQRNMCPMLCFPSSPNPKHKNRITTKRKCAIDNNMANFIICI